MSDEQRWTFPAEVQPRADETQFDLSRALDAVVLLRSTFPEDSMTASTLGTERGGYGVVINEKTLAADVKATEQQRARLRSGRTEPLPFYDRGPQFQELERLYHEKQAAKSAA